LAAIGPKGRADHLDLMLGLGGDQEVRINRAAVKQVRAGEEIAIGQVLLDAGAHDAIRRGRRCGYHVGDEMREVGITGLRDMALIAHPCKTALRAVPRLWIVGRRD
jgi:hypothetical protein